MNVGDAYLDGGLTREGWHDTDLFIEGPAAQEAARTFLKLWETSRYLASDRPFPPFEKEEVRAFRRIFKEDVFSFSFPLPADPQTGRAYEPGDPRRMQKVEIPLAGPLADPRYFPRLEPDTSWTVPVRIVYDNPLVDRTGDGETYSKVMRSIQYLLRLSRKQALLFLPYLTPERGFVEELKAAARRGVLVAIVTNSERSHDIGTIPWKAGTALYPELAEAGVHILEWQGHADLLELERREGCTIPDGSWPGRTIHSKVVVVDGAFAVVGSHNMNARSEAYNTEVMAFVSSREVAGQLVEAFVDDADLEPGKRTITCGGRLLARPAKSERISVEKARSLEEEVGWKAGFLQKLRAVM
jgi:phosphatidylserine/phosphatidylglycerophosphate/cardiolipin synthase-like enzyme